MRNTPTAAAWIIFWICHLTASFCLAAAGHLVTKTGTAMGTAMQVRVYTESADEAPIYAAIAEAFAEIRRLEGLMTTWRPDSEISRINAAAGVAPVAVGPEVFSVLRRSLEFSRLSGGAFDVSYYALRGLWKFDDDLAPVLPDPAELARRRRLIDWRQIILTPVLTPGNQPSQGQDPGGTVLLRRAGMAINLGGIGKGFAVDAASGLLRRRGFPNHIVQAGGDLFLSGSKAGQPWMSGVRDPRGPGDDYFAVCAVTDHAFSTAGDYERSFVLKGRRYHHIIDPRTGYPATGARSVTIYARDATTADGLDDAVLILGVPAGLALVERLKDQDVGAVIVDRQNRVHVSSRLKDLVRIVHQPTPGL